MIQKSPFIVLGVSGEYYHFYIILHRNLQYANSVDPDQMPCSLAFELVCPVCICP